MVPVAGLEPARINRRILSAVRLPFRHTGMFEIIADFCNEIKTYPVKFSMRCKMRCFVYNRCKNGEKKKEGAERWNSMRGI